jgi:NAD(P)-dependent dehydrogenase (short-subunit alcohol dehydrogenase family)
MTQSLFSIEKKTILVTGATSGIGNSTATECAKCGAIVIATGRNEQKLATLEHQVSQCIVADLTDEDSVSKLIEALPQLDGVVLCAGVNNVFPTQFATRKKIDSVMETNFYAQVELLRLLVKKKKLKSPSSVVAISSIGGVEAFSLGQAAYGASKAALLSWMKYSAKELAPKQIRVNCICPGHINTPMNENLAFSDEDLDKYRKTIPLQRFGEPQDIASAVIYLLSDAASWITGSSLKVDGGTTL